MRGTLREDARIELVRKAGSVTAAADVLVRTISCSDSKAEKIAAGRYPSQITALEAGAIARKLKWPLGKVFDPAATGKKVAS